MYLSSHKRRIVWNYFKDIFAALSPVPFVEH
jgi:hypothetical protein